MTFTDFLSRFDRVTPNGMVRCPAHDDRNPSLHPSEGDDGRILLKCFAGCTAEQIVKAMNLTLADLMPENGRRERTVAATYDYLDESATLLFQTVRYSPKDFKQRRPDGNGDWIWNLRDTRRVLYRLPELLAADPAEPVFVCEGEKDVDRLRSLRLIATCNPMGAGKWRDEYSETLRGRWTVILPDNDEPGRGHAETAKKSLTGKARRAQILSLPPEMGKDVSDWLDSGGTDVELMQLASLTEWRKSPLRSHTPEQLHKIALTMPPRDLIVEPYLAKYESVFLYGPKGHGKTWAGVGTAMVGARGHGARFLNFAAPKEAPGIPTLYVDGEMFTVGLDQRVQDINRTANLDPGDNLLLWTPDAQDSEHTVLNLFAEEGRQMLEDHIEDIFRETGKVIGQIYFDNMASLLHGWEENKQESWGKFAPWLLRLRARRIGNFWIHHANKEGGYRGNSAMIGAMHAVLNVQHPEGWTADKGANFEFKYEWTRSKPTGLANFSAKLEGDAWTVEEQGDTTDEQIVAYVREDPKRPHTQIAKMLGVSRYVVDRAVIRLSKPGGPLALPQEKP